MKKKFLSFLICAAMLMALLPAAVFAIVHVPDAAFDFNVFVAFAILPFMGVVEKAVVNTLHGAADAIDDRVCIRCNFRIGIDCQCVRYGKDASWHDKQDVTAVQRLLYGFILVSNAIWNGQDDFLHSGTSFIFFREKTYARRQDAVVT